VHDFFLAVESSHGTTLELRGGNKVQTYQVFPGSNRFCVDGDHELEVHTSEGCFRFKAIPSIVEAATEKISLEVSNYLFEGTISSPTPVKDLKLFSIDRDETRSSVDLKKVDKGYTFNLFVKTGDHVKLEPVSQEAFFEPSGGISLKPKNNCEENVVSFIAKKGLFVEGRVQPAVEGVVVSVIEGSQRVITQKDGTFRIGPFRDAKETSNSQLVAAKEGYHFELVEPTVFKARKLSSIEVTATDDKGKPLPNEAVVSLSDTSGSKS